MEAEDENGGGLVFRGNLMDPAAWEDSDLVAAYDRAVATFRSVRSTENKEPNEKGNREAKGEGQSETREKGRESETQGRGKEEEQERGKEEAKERGREIYDFSWRR